MRVRARTRRTTASIAASAAVGLAALVLPLAVALAADPPPIGPPFPDPVVDQAVYDYAGVFSPATIASAEATIDAIEARTGAEIAVYTQNVHVKPSTEETDARARALIDQWGVGRKGFDDGMVIFFDLDDSLVHGQVILYAGAGYEAAFLSRSERQALFEDEMLPRLQAEDLDGALLVALARIDANATPEHAALLQTARQVDAAVGLIGAPLIFMLLAAWVVGQWWRYGRDPVYLDDPSILMPAPPPELSAASAVFVIESQASRRALTTALLDLASRGAIAFRKVDKFLGRDQVAIDIDPPAPDPVTEAHRGRNSRRAITSAERYAEERLRAIAKDGAIEPDDLLEFGEKVSKFNDALERHVVAKNWLTEPPSKVRRRWGVRGGAAVVGGFILIGLGSELPSQGLILLGVAAIAGGGLILLFARFMPAVTMAGAMLRAMLAAYRRTLKKTMEQARSMDEVVAGSGLTWLETPDQAVVWGTALGLQEEIEEVLRRSLEDVERGVASASSTYLPSWYRGSDGTPLSSSAGSSGGGGGLFSSSAIPSIGGMMASLGTIGNSPSSSGGGGGGFGGGGGGGGGGSGGGF